MHRAGFDEMPLKASLPWHCMQPRATATLPPLTGSAAGTILPYYTHQALSPASLTSLYLAPYNMYFEGQKMDKFQSKVKDDRPKAYLRPYLLSS